MTFEQSHLDKCIGLWQRFLGMRSASLYLSDGDELIAARFRAAIPRLIHVRNCRACTLRRSKSIWNLRRVVAQSCRCIPNLRENFRAIASQLFSAFHNLADF